MGIPSFNRKKIAAMLLLGLFLFIQGEKLFHSHHGRIAKTEAGAAAIKSVNTGCPICEFQLAQDAQLPSDSFTDIPFKLVPGKFATEIPSYSYLHFCRVSGRGPPAFML